MKGWQLILINPMIAYDFNDGHFENILKKSQESHCSFIYFTEADMDLINKLEPIYKEDAPSLRSVSQTISNRLPNSLMGNRQRFHTLDVNEFNWKLKQQKMIQLDNKIDPLLTSKLSHNSDLTLEASDFMVFERQKKDRSCLSRPTEDRSLSSEFILSTKLKANLIRVPDSMELREGTTTKINIMAINCKISWGRHVSCWVLNNWGCVHIK